MLQKPLPYISRYGLNNMVFSFRESPNKAFSPKKSLENFFHTNYISSAKMRMYKGLQPLKEF